MLRLSTRYDYILNHSFWPKKWQNWWKRKNFDTLVLITHFYIRVHIIFFYLMNILLMSILPPSLGISDGKFQGTPPGKNWKNYLYLGQYWIRKKMLKISWTKFELAKKIYWWFLTVFAKRVWGQYRTSKKKTYVHNWTYPIKTLDLSIHMTIFRVIIFWSKKWQNWSKQKKNATIVSIT